LFTDESRFGLDHNDGRVRVWRRPGERYIDSTLQEIVAFGGGSITQAWTDFDVCIKLTVFEQFRPPDYENDFGFALSRLVFSQIVFS
jgi:hypothetical protein